MRDRTGLSFSLDRSTSIEQQAIRAATPSGLYLDLVRQPSDRVSFSSRIEHALTAAQRLRIDVRHSDDDASNQGLGEFNLPERAFTRQSSNGELRIGHNATLRRQMVHDFRFETSWRSSQSVPRSLTTALNVPGSLSSGVSISGGRYRGDEWRNVGGTFTFASLDDLTSGRATSFTQRTGDPRFQYSMYRFGTFVQDDVRVRPNLGLNIGVRHELQTHLSDLANVAPRLGFTWTPSRRLRTTLRGGFSVSYQSFQGSTYEQTLVVNGERQRELVIVAPSYPNPFLDGVPAASRPPGIIRANPDLEMPATRRFSFGVDQPIARLGRLRASYSRQTGHNLFRSIDENAPVNGTRPDPAVRNITELESSARSLSESLELNLQLNYQPRRLNANVRYTLGQQWNETDGALTLPPESFNLADEWGPSRQDIRHRLEMSVNSELGGGFRVNANGRAQSAAPYTITTGFDTNGDGVNNERPVGVGRNSARGLGTKNLDMTLAPAARPRGPTGGQCG